MTESENQAMAMGEIRGQMRELLKGVSGLSEKIDQLSRIVHESTHLPAEVSELKASVRALEVRVAALEHAGAESRGERGLAAGVLKSPLVAYAITAAVAFAGWVKGLWG